MVQPSTLPAESLFKGFIRAYYVGTHTADVQLAASPRETIAGVRVATHIHAADAVVDRECTVLFFAAANCQDAVVIGVQGALPSGGGGGVTDHGALTGLGDDDHTQYALADKSRPSPWVAAADLTARSLADLGTRDHHLAAGLSDDDHPQYALLLGRAGGQQLFGDTASGGHLYLQSTAHATRGYVKSQDDLQLLTGYLRDSDGTARIQLATASPHVAITGDADVSGHLAVGNLASVLSPYALEVYEQGTTHPCVGIHDITLGVKTSGLQFTFGISGGASGQGTPSASYVYGLYFYAQHNTASPNNALGGIYIQQQSGASGSGALAIARGLYVAASYWANAKPATSIGLDIEEQGDATTTTAYGVRILNQTGVAVRLLEVGTTPYLRLVGGAAPAAGLTHLWLYEGTTPQLRNVGFVVADAGGHVPAGAKVLYLV